MADRMIAALRLVATHSPGAAAEALRLMRAAVMGGARLEGRCARVLELALTDPRSSLSPDERGMLADLAATWGTVDEGGRRDRMVRLRLSAVELGQLKDMAGGRPLSAWIRSQLLG